MVQKPEVHCHYIVDEDKVAHLAAGAIAAVFAKEPDLALVLELAELVKRHAGHAALVLLARAIDVEVPEPGHLRLRVFKLAAKFAPQPLVKKQLGVAINIEWLFELGCFAEGVRAAVSGR